jgi:uncharacterized small protein (DUF1192 family)
MAKGNDVATGSQAIFGKLVDLYSAFGKLCSEIDEAQASGDTDAIGNLSARREGIFKSIEKTRTAELQTVLVDEIREEIARLPAEIKRLEGRAVELEAEAMKRLEADLPALLEVLFSVGGKMIAESGIQLPEGLRSLLAPARSKAEKGELRATLQQVVLNRHRIASPYPFEVADRATALNTRAMQMAEGFSIEKHLFGYYDNR